MQLRPRTLLGPAALALACYAPPQEPEHVTIIPPLRVTAMTGTVVDAGGKPLAGATVQVSGIEVFQDGVWQREMRLGLMPSYTTDERGMFELQYSEKERLRYDLWAVKHGYAPTFVSAVSSDLDPPRIALERGIEITGRVSRNTGEETHGLAGAAVVLEHPTADLWYTQTVYTNTDGDYTLRIPTTRDGHWQARFLDETAELVPSRKSIPVAPHFVVTIATLVIYD